MPQGHTNLKLPQLHRVTLHRFSLYAANPDADFTCGNGVLCLIGANGLGKSTLLSAINFCLTGIVSEPGRDFKSMEEYYIESRRYSTGYFRGRITESDRAEAEITLEFRVGDAHYTLKRGLFEPEELRAFTITKTLDKSVEFATEGTTRRERQLAYETRLIADIGLTSFAEFVFLQLFVFTFDERRITLFWNQKILERVLYLAFGLDPNTAKQVDTLKREHDAVDSRVRNRQFEATRTNRRVNDLRAQSHSSGPAQVNYDLLSQEQERLTKAYESNLSASEGIAQQLKDANLRLATLFARESALREEYAHFFEEGLERRPPIARHPLLVKSLAEHTCGLCGTKGDVAIQTIQGKLNEPNCPLCDSLITTSPPPNEDITRLSELDREIVKARAGIGDVLKELERVRSEETVAREKMEATKEKLASFDRANETTMLALRQTLSGTGSVDAMLVAYRAQLASLLDEKKVAEQRRAELKQQLNARQKDLQRRYLDVEREFVPVFTALAYHFLGMPMEIKMDISESAGVNLVIDVRGTARREPHQLSESQRFFLDIALRMAITQFISDPASQGTLFIDTPEGSLDIAYEKRAGEMLAKFVEAGHMIVMTANLNSSKLLLALADSCGQSHMQLCRMTDWAELSEVQQQEEALFDDAYNEIEKALGT